MVNENEEIWKEIEFKGYFISNFGRLKGRSGKILKTPINKNTGYHMVCIRPYKQSRKMKCLKISRLVAKAFVPNPENKPFVNHIDGNKLNNFYKNLEWCTNQENIIHAYKHGLITILKGENKPGSKMTNKQAKWIREHYIPKNKEFGTRALGRKFGVHHSTIESIIHNKSYTED